MVISWYSWYTNNSVPVSQFLIDGYAPPFRLDRDNNVRNIMFFVRGNIPCKLLSVENHPMEDFYVEVNLAKPKWLLWCSYNPIECKIDFDLWKLNRSFASYLSNYENFIIVGYFNVKTNDSSISVFRQYLWL